MTIAEALIRGTGAGDIYTRRPQMIAPERFRFGYNYNRFFEDVFEMEGIRAEMENLFGGDEIIRPIFEIAMRERKAIPGLVMLTAHVLAYDLEKAKRLAAISQFAWGMIVAYDDVTDNHHVRKGKETLVASRGQVVALDITMLSLGAVLEWTLGDKKLGERFLGMLKSTCSGDIASRELTWDDPPERYVQVMGDLVAAFSWFPEYIGEQTGLPTVGRNFAQFLRHTHVIGQMNNDIEDIEPPTGKHETGSDILQGKITLFWRMLIDRPIYELKPEEKVLIKKVFAEKGEELEEFRVVLAIAKRLREDTAGGKLFAYILAEREAARQSIETAFNEVSTLDESNLIYYEVLFDFMDVLWERYQDFEGRSVPWGPWE